MLLNLSWNLMYRWRRYQHLLLRHLHLRLLFRFRQLILLWRLRHLRLSLKNHVDLMNHQYHPSTLLCFCRWFHLGHHRHLLHRLHRRLLRQTLSCQYWMSLKSLLQTRDVLRLLCLPDHLGHRRHRHQRHPIGVRQLTVCQVVFRPVEVFLSIRKY